MPTAVFPQEIIDEIILLLPFDDIRKLTNILSKHARQLSKFDDIDTAFRQNGDPQQFFWLQRQRSQRCSTELFHEVGLAGDMEKLQCLYRYAYDFDAYAVANGACEAGHLHVLEWLYDNFVDFDVNISTAALYGQLELVKWLHDKPYIVATDQAMNFAAGEGHLHVVKWLHANTTWDCTRDAMDDAARAGHLHVMQWLHVHRNKGCSSYAFIDAIHQGHHRVVNWLYESAFIEWLFDGSESCDVDVRIAVIEAASKGNFRMLQVLDQHGFFERCECSLYHDIARMAARNGHLKTLQW